jgi:RHS repeat-associated protein
MTAALICYTYDAVSYTYNAESQMKTANGVTYAYDGDGRRVYKSNGKLYWYGAGGDILAETDGSGNTLNEYVFFGGKRVAMLPAGGNPIYYVEDILGTSRVITQNNGTVCYDADFDPFGGEHPYANTCPQNYKFEGKERDTETGNDDFGARSYSSRFGRWLSADWSSVPVPVPYANLTNPQTLNLYSMVADDPESFADLDGHAMTQIYQLANTGAGIWGGDPTGGSDFWVNQDGLAVLSLDNGGNGLFVGLNSSAQGTVQPQSNRQPDGSYKATPAQLAEIRERNEHRKDKNGNPIMITAPNDPDGQCVTACKHFTGVPGPTSSWRAGKNATDLTDADIGLAIATFVGSGSKARFPKDGNQNSAVFMGKGIGGIWVADQWPSGKPTTIWFMPTHNFRNPDTRSVNAETYRVIIVPKP